MTREEAIKELQNCKGLIQQDGQDYLDERDIPLLDMAIEALSADAVQGEWRRTLEDLESGFVRCNKCDTQFDYYEINQLAQESCEKDFPNFCPNCGAKMGGGKE